MMRTPSSFPRKQKSSDAPRPPSSFPRRRESSDSPTNATGSPPSRGRRVTIALLARWFLCSVLFAASTVHADEALWALLQKGGQVVLVRHAVTDPGVGDPPGFKVDDCATQRNLSEAGKREAERLGAAIKARNVPVARVLTSPWCRCRDTATIAFGGADVDTSLSNLFVFPQNRDRQLAGFRKLVAAAPKTGNLFLITHGATTLAFTGVSPGTAEMVIVTPQPDGQVRVAGRIPLP